MTICAFAGHREVYQSAVEARLDAEIEKLLQTDDEFLFLTGGMGQFDSMGAGAVRAAKALPPLFGVSLASCRFLQYTVFRKQ